MSKIVIDAGHGKNTAGKRCLKSLDKNETRECILMYRSEEFENSIYLIVTSRQVSLLKQRTKTKSLSAKVLKKH